MESKIMNIFYGADNLPYKDQPRTVHFPIVGQAFMGASNTTEIRFYTDKIGSIDATYISIAKLPNGKVGTKILTKGYDAQIDENYVSLKLSNFYTQAKGDLYISLNGYEGGVELIYNKDTGLVWDKFKNKVVKPCQFPPVKEIDGKFSQSPIIWPFSSISA